MMDFQSEPPIAPGVDNNSSLEDAASRRWSGLDDILSKDSSSLLPSAKTPPAENNSYGAYSSTSTETSFMNTFTKFVENVPGFSSDSEDGANFRLLKGNKSEPPPVPPPSVSSSTCSSTPRPVALVPKTQDSSSGSSSSSESDYEDQLRKRTKKKTKMHHHKKIKKLNGNVLKKLSRQMDSTFGLPSENGGGPAENSQPSPSNNNNNTSEDFPEKVKKKLGRPTLAEQARKRQCKLGGLPSPRGKEETSRCKEPVFLQNGPCFEVGAKLSRCRECRLPSHQRNKKMPNIFCRFYHFRKLKITKTGINSGGFAEPEDSTEEDLSLWIPSISNPPKDITVKTAIFLLTHVGDQFCEVVSQEKEAKSIHLGPSNMVAWKRVVTGVREMCDVCETTIFNSHWVCRRCGFVVCLDCYKARQALTNREDLQDREENQWLLCTNRQVHDLSKLMLTEIVAGSSLDMLNKMLHEVRKKWNIPAYCKCPLNQTPPQRPASSSNIIPLCKQLVSGMRDTFPKFRQKLMPSTKKTNPTTPAGVPEKSSPPPQEPKSSLSWMLEAMEAADSEPEASGPCTLKDLKEELRDSEARARAEARLKENEEVYKCIMFHLTGKKDPQVYKRRFPSTEGPPTTWTCSKLESDCLYSNVPHNWLCGGKLLLLKDPLHPGNLELFQEQWKRGQPVMVEGVSGQLDMSLWHPDGFSRDFGEVTNDLVNCRTGTIIPDLPMKKFWEGFEDYSKRLMDEKGEKMLLKLKDWPPGEDFSELLPDRFQDLMKALPLAPYTHRDGVLNLAARLPSTFVRPDLGPKMYNAYGSALYPTKGTTNLHLDISDAVNVMVYVGAPQSDKNEDTLAAFSAIDNGGCDPVCRRRVREKGVRPGALWHIYNAKDADKIRMLLNKVATERGDKLEAHHDPIHDQSWYLDTELRSRLYREYGVTGYAIGQCLGDAVFIPAGAPHQVRNLHSCVKVAEDFVSPENVGHCFTLTQEFRDLSDTHTNHEDKLQIKNIIYHTVRDALSLLLTAEDMAAMNPTPTPVASPPSPPPPPAPQPQQPPLQQTSYQNIPSASESQQDEPRESQGSTEHIPASNSCSVQETNCPEASSIDESSCPPPVKIKEEPPEPSSSSSHSDRLNGGDAMDIAIQPGDEDTSLEQKADIPPPSSPSTPIQNPPEIKPEEAISTSSAECLDLKISETKENILLEETKQCQQDNPSQLPDVKPPVHIKTEPLTPTKPASVPPAKVPYEFIKKILISDIIEGKNPYKATYCLSLKPFGDTKTSTDLIHVLNIDCPESQLLLKKAYEGKLALNLLSENIGNPKKIQTWTSNLDKKECTKWFKFVEEFLYHSRLKRARTLYVRLRDTRRLLYNRLAPSK